MKDIKDMVIGNCQSCPGSCLGSEMSDFDNVQKHLEEAHSFTKFNMYEKKIKYKVLELDEYVQIHLKQFLDGINSLMDVLRQTQKSVQAKMKKIRNDCVFKKSKLQKEKLIEILQSFEQGKLKNVNCHQMHLFMNSIDGIRNDASKQTLEKQVFKVIEHSKKEILQNAEEMISGKKQNRKQKKNGNKSKQIPFDEENEQKEEKKKKYSRKVTVMDEQKSPKLDVSEKNQQKKRKKTDKSEDDGNVVKVIDLKKDSYKKNAKKFTIKLKILKFILFRYISKQKKIYVEEKMDERSLYQRVKFIGGDDTGTVVCFTNWKEDLKEESVIQLTNCELQLYEGQSYEVYTDCTIHHLRDDFDEINVQRSISKLDDPVNLVYSMQKYDPHYPTIKELKSAEFGKSKSKDELSFIVKVQNIYEDQNEYQAGISDFTGNTIALLSKSDGKNIKEGDVLLLRNIRVEKLGDGIYRMKKSGKKHSWNEIKVVQDFVFPGLKKQRKRRRNER